MEIIRERLVIVQQAFGLMTVLRPQVPQVVFGIGFAGGSGGSDDVKADLRVNNAPVGDGNPVPVALRVPVRQPSQVLAGESGVVDVPEGFEVMSYVCHTSTGGVIAVAGTPVPLRPNSDFGDSSSGILGPTTFDFAVTDFYYIVIRRYSGLYYIDWDSLGVDFDNTAYTF